MCPVCDRRAPLRRPVATAAGLALGRHCASWRRAWRAGSRPVAPELVPPARPPSDGPSEVTAIGRGASEASCRAGRTTSPRRVGTVVWGRPGRSGLSRAVRAVSPEALGRPHAQPLRAPSSSGAAGARSPDVALPSHAGGSVGGWLSRGHRAVRLGGQRDPEALLQHSRHGGPQECPESPGAPPPVSCAPGPRAGVRVTGSGRGRQPCGLG